VTVEERGSLVLIRIEGSHFLWKMVRRMVGVMVAVGQGSLEEGDIDELLREPSGLPATLTAPASGLFLERVRYRDDTIPHDRLVSPGLLNVD
jgi:tRNA pseudouridine38-40 synthase